jgi:colanic acid/amylovoran biosynthesis glycosyltransferase
MAEADVFLLSSVTTSDGVHEGQGLALQEAQACGLPVIATNHGPFSESTVPGRSAYLVPERDVDALADALGKLLSHPDRWAAMGDAGRAHVEGRYDSDTLNRRLVDVYAQAIAAYRTSSTRA